jgi:hypothetical protein
LEEVDRAARVWTIPKERMKMVDRTVFRFAVEHSKSLMPPTRWLTHRACIPSVRSKPLSDGTLSKLVKELDFERTSTGFERPSARGRRSAQTSPARSVRRRWRTPLVTRPNAHTRAPTCFEKRRKLMDSWAAFIAAQRAEVVLLAVGA